MTASDMTAGDSHPTETDTRHTVVAPVVAQLLLGGLPEGRAEALLAELGLSERRRFDFEVRLPEGGALTALDTLGEAGLDAGLAACASPEGHFSPVWHLASAAEVVADLLDVVRGYFWLLWTRLRLQVVVDRDDVSIVAPPLDDRVGVHVLLRYLVAEQIWSTQNAFASRPVPVRSLVLPGPPGSDAAGWRRLIGAEPRFHGEVMRLVLPREALDIPCRKPDATLSGWLRYVLDQRVAELPAVTPLRQEVAELVRRRLARPPSRGAVAAALGLQARTLARRLASEGTSFRDVVDAVRFEAAKAWLPDGSVAEVSERLGFADTRSFQRAFRRWAGVSPSAWRRGGLDRG